ncbi:hypothetical protein JB92DRAFT_2851125 [Gautieria morchelliformis]|nr:hypothetical protein JB92DRAFT_2851125 [Gautieria morchelliformis]
MTIPSLPSEIILQVLEAGYFNHKFRPDRSYLNTCCRVCRAWAAQAQPLLFRHVEVRTPSSLPGLKEALTRPSHRRSALKDVVLWLKVWIGTTPTVSSPADLSSLLSICSNLYGLSVTFRNMWTLPEVPVILPPNVSALECCDWEGELGVEITRILVRSGWASLRILVLRGCPPICQISPNLTELRIECHSTFLHEPWNTRKPKLNLRILDVSQHTICHCLLEFSRHSLESVIMPWWLSPLALKDCLRLREFKTETFISQELSQVLRDLPLEHLAYAVIPTCRVEDFSVQCVSLSPRLQVVSCLTSVRPWDERMTNYIDELEQLCHRKQVRLDCYTTLRSFRALTRGSLAPTDTYPRGLVVPNFARLRL